MANSETEPAAEGPSLFVWALPAALLAAVALQMNRAPGARLQPDSRARAVPELERYSELALPNCIAAGARRGLSEGGRFGFDQDMRRTLTLAGDGRIQRGEAVFSWTPETGELRPVNAAARLITDFRTACR